MSKRVTVENPGEPKCKKFEDWEKKSKDVYSAYKSAKRTIPKGTPTIVLPAKKEEVDCITPQLVNFVWTKDLGEMYPSVNLSNGDKAKLLVYDRYTLSGKNECSWYAPVFNPIDFKNADRADDDDTWTHGLYKAINEGDAEKLGKLLADNLVVEYPGQPKMNKDQWIEFTKNFKALNHELFLAPVLTVADKENVSEGVAAVKRTFKWSAALNDAFKVEFAEDAAVEIKGYDNLKVKDGKLVYLGPAFNPALNIKPAGGKGAGN
jgi:ketosteroid isomerase-like protein